MKNLKEIWKYIVESRIYILFSITFFLYAFLASFIFKIPPEIENAIKEMIQKLAESLIGMNFFEIFLFILKNNIYVSFIAVFFGILFSIVPIIIIFSNGYLLGYVTKIINERIGIAELWRILPHGIFELPAFFLSVSIGIKFGTFLFSENPKREFMKRLILSFKTFIYFIIPLLIIAALIESGLIVILG